MVHMDKNGGHVSPQTQLKKKIFTENIFPFKLSVSCKCIALSLYNVGNSCILIGTVMKCVFTDVTQCNDVQYQTQVREVHPGDPVTLYCVFSKEDLNMFWYKQMVGQKPQTIVTMTKYDKPVWHKDFNHSRVNVEKADADGMYRLAITNTDPTDEAVYYCAVRTAYEVNFINGTLLLLKGKNHQRSHYHTVVQRPVSDPVHPGHSVTLLCTVLSETCTGERSVYWFRARSGESHPGVIYTSANKSDECKKSPETPSPTQSCVYSLSKNNLSLSDAGTYYCAVATCGEILFGNGTILNIKKATDPVIIALGVTSAVCVIGIIILICTRHTRSVCEHCKGQLFNFANCYLRII
ncbi:unnamed protein product [Oncorhynchus mykiss]|uniref:Ig-like domain-containing protein n=1 Tax=Oncorhynchus mykiss TaxID=8022 RepID=A0A060X0G5_ONCMY|nr:unnamed protein product [Oncorhynchus mykiss]